MSDGICGGDVPPLVGGVLSGTGLTLAQAAERLVAGDSLVELCGPAPHGRGVRL